MARDSHAAASLDTEAGGLPYTQPHSIEAEQWVIGGLMLDNSAWDERIADCGLKPSDFYRREHRLIFSALVKLAEQSQPMDVVTVGERLERDGYLDDVGGLTYLGELAHNIPSVANIRTYAQIVRERSELREIAQICFAGARRAYTAKGISSRVVLEEVESSLFALSEASSSDTVNFNAALRNVLDGIDQRSESNQPISGLDSGLRDLNALTGGLKPGHLVLLGARPSMGKTSLALQLALAALDPLTEAQPERTAESENQTATSVQIYSMEMSAEEIILRLLAQKGQLDGGKLGNGKLREDDWQRLLVAAHALQATSPRLALDETGALTPAMLRAKARRAARRFGMPKLIVIDYLQLMHIGDKSENRNQEIASISRALKALAKEMHCPVVLLSQLNRNLEQRGDKRPYLSDLRDSGAIEQDADLVLLYRDEVYHSESLDKGTAEIIVGKNRNGATGTVKVAWIAEQTRFADLAGYEGA